MGDDAWPPEQDPEGAVLVGAGGLVFPNWRRRSMPDAGEGAKDPYYDRLGADSVELDDIRRALTDRGTGGPDAARLGAELAARATSWTDLAALVRQQLYGSHAIDGPRTATTLIDAAGDAFARRRGEAGDDTAWLFKADLDQEYRRWTDDRRRARAGSIARRLERADEEEYEQFLLELQAIRNLPQLRQQLRVMQVDPRRLQSTVFRMSGAAADLVAAIEAALRTAAPYISVALDLVPVVGTIKGIAEAAIGRDLITGEELPPWARGLSAGLALLPFARGAFRGAATGARSTTRASSQGLRNVAALAHQVGPDVAPRDLYLVTRGLSSVPAGALETAARVRPGRITAAEKAAIAEVASRLPRTASGLIEDGRVLARAESGVIDTGRGARAGRAGRAGRAAETSAGTAAEAISGPARTLVDQGFLPAAVQALERSGVRVTRRLASQLLELGDTGRSFLALFHRSKGFQRVVRDLAQGGRKADGARFVMRYAATHPDILAKVRTDPALVAFEWGAGITKGTPVGDVFARSVDIVVRGDGRLGVGYTVYNELKSWTAATLRSSRNRTVRRQVVYDLAILDPVVAGRGGLPRGIRWVFDRTKIGRKDTIIDTFVEVIQSDAYLRHRWGTDLPRIRQALDQFIELAP